MKNALPRKWIKLLCVCNKVLRLVKGMAAMWLASPFSVLVGGLLGSTMSPLLYDAIVSEVAAGMLTYVWALDVLPNVVRSRDDVTWEGSIGAKEVASLGGMIVGLAAMLSLRKGISLQERVAMRTSEQKPYPWRTVLPVGVELFVDALLSGMHVGYSDVRRSSSALTLLLNGMLTWIVAQDLREANVEGHTQVLTIGALATLSVAGTLLGLYGSHSLEKQGVIFKGLLGFATVTIAWLIVGDLLPARFHRTDHQPAKSAFFGGEFDTVPLPYFLGLAAGVFSSYVTHGN